MKTSLPSIKINISTKENIKRSVEKFNQGSIVKLSIQEFRRLSYELLSQMILQSIKIPLELLPK